MCLIFANYWITILHIDNPKNKATNSGFYTTTVFQFFWALWRTKKEPRWCHFSQDLADHIAWELSWERAPLQDSTFMSHPYVPWPNLGELVSIAHIDRDQYTHYKDSHYMGCFFLF
jgi:hypothetical protein